MYAHPLLVKTSAAAENTPRNPQAEAVLLRTPASRPQTILLPFDGTPSSDRALEHVLELARWREVFVHLLNVQPPVMAGDVTLFRSARAVELERRAAASAPLAAAKAALNAAGVRYVAEVAFGSPADEIVRCATTSGCSKIVMGSGRNGLLARFLGSLVAYRVSRRAPVPVTIIPQQTGTVTPIAGPRFAHAFASAKRLGSWRKRSCSHKRGYQAP
jgi:nucleotide-binding universal stress UspA family protein